MRCKKHFSDLSSTVGVCATCLRERLIPLLAVQSPPLIFPRSVSPPRVTKSAVDLELFYSTPQLGPTIPALYNNPCSRRREKEKKSPSALSLLLPKFLRSGGATSSSWISDLFPRRRRKNPPPPPPAEGCRRVFSGRGRGMSPARVSDCGGDGDFDNGRDSGYSTTTPRRRGGNVAAFCLSPMVRPSPNRRRDAVEAPAGMAAAAAFCANRSRKMADFGRLHRRQ